MRLARGTRSRPGPQPRRGHRRDRRGRGLRGELAPRSVPLNRTRSEAFDDLVLDAIDELEQHWAHELRGLEFAVEDVPPASALAMGSADLARPGPDVVLDRGVVLGRLLREGIGTERDPDRDENSRGGERIDGPVVVIYRRPVEARSLDRDDRADLVFMVVVDLVAEFLGRDIDEIDPQ